MKKNANKIPFPLCSDLVYAVRAVSTLHEYACKVNSLYSFLFYQLRVGRLRSALRLSQ